jgi:prepilin-type N-terminal cleavage/methylation domain-containing protein
MTTIAELGFRNADMRFDESQRRFRALSIRNPQSVIRNAGVTLIELLIAISIIATLSALFLGASRAAMESSRASRTKTTILKLHTLLMEQWASYETRRVDVKKSIVKDIEDRYTAGTINATQRGQELSIARLKALRETMKLEIPDRWSDVTGANFGDTPFYPPQFPTMLDDRPTLSKIYLRRYISIDPSSTFEGAECLYMTVMLACGDGEARTMFSAQDIGDVDDDGAPEFLDGWGRPIFLIRWPAGYISPLQSVTAPDGLASINRVGDTLSDHDPFDPFHLDPTAYRLVPLIFSAGPDTETLFVARDSTMAYPSGEPRLHIDPYAPIYGNDQNSDIVRAGTTGGPDRKSTDHVDDITNHLIDGR